MKTVSQGESSCEAPSRPQRPVHQLAARVVVTLLLHAV